MTYFFTGQIRHSSFYVKGKRHGEAREWNIDGQIVLVCNYQNNKLHGEYFARDDRFFQKVTYVNGKMNGKRCIYWDNGQLFEEITYVSGRQIGPYRMMNQDGSVMKEFEYNKKGNLEGRCVEYHNNGNVSCISYFKDGLKHGKFVKYHENGDLHIFAIYSDNEETKEWQEHGMSRHLKKKVKKIEPPYYH